jgi:hypothetical protein
MKIIIILLLIGYSIVVKKAYAAADISDEVFACNWAKTVTPEVTKLSGNTKKHLEEIKKLFTKEGYESFLKALKKSGGLKNALDKKVVQKAVINDEKPLFVSEHYSDNKKQFFHSIFVPIYTIYDALDKNEHQLRQMYLYLKIQHLTDDPIRQQLAIAQLIMFPKAKIDLNEIKQMQIDKNNPLTYNTCNE